MQLFDADQPLFGLDCSGLRCLGSSAPPGPPGSPGSSRSFNLAVNLHAPMETTELLLPPAPNGQWIGDFPPCIPNLEFHSRSPLLIPPSLLPNPRTSTVNHSIFFPMKRQSSAWPMATRPFESHHHAPDAWSGPSWPQFQPRSPEPNNANPWLYDSGIPTANTDADADAGEDDDQPMSEPDYDDDYDDEASRDSEDDGDGDDAVDVVPARPATLPLAPALAPWLVSRRQQYGVPYAPWHRVRRPVWQPRIHPDAARVGVEAVEVGVNREWNAIGVMDALTGQCFVQLIDDRLSDRLPALPGIELPRLIVMRESVDGGVWLGGIVWLLAKRVAAFAYDLFVRDGNELQRELCIFGQPHQVYHQLAVKRATRDCLHGPALRAALTDFQLTHKRLVVWPSCLPPLQSPTDLRLFSDISTNADTPASDTGPRAYLVCDGRVVFHFNSAMKASKPQEPLTLAATMQKHPAAIRIFAPSQLDTWLNTFAIL